MKKIRTSSLILASFLLLGSAVSCKHDTVKDPNEPSASPAVTSELKPEIIMTGNEPATQGETVPRPADLERSVAANPGDLFISVSDGDMNIQYNGSSTDPRHTMLSYNAVNAPVTGNGDYTVSVTANTKGFRFDMTGDENNNSVLPEGLQSLLQIVRIADIICRQDAGDLAFLLKLLLELFGFLLREADFPAAKTVDDERLPRHKSRKGVLIL